MTQHPPRNAVKCKFCRWIHYVVELPEIPASTKVECTRCGRDKWLIGSDEDVPFGSTIPGLEVSVGWYDGIAAGETAGSEKTESR